jgi:hypothetical protein
MDTLFQGNNVNSLLVMLRDNKHLENLILRSYIDLKLWEILKVVAQHGSLRHLELPFIWSIPVNNQEEWKDVFSQICTRLTSFKSPSAWSTPGCFDPLVKAKFLTTLKLGSFPSSETFRQMADNYTCLQNIEFYKAFNSRDYSDVAYFLEKQSETLTSLKIYSTRDPMTAISQCRNLKRVELKCLGPFLNYNSLGSFSNLRSLCLSVNNSDLGRIIEAANLQHLIEIGFKAADQLEDDDIGQIARTYGKQVFIKAYTKPTRKSYPSKRRHRTTTYNIHRSSKHESIQTIIFIQPDLQENVVTNLNISA